MRTFIRTCFAGVALSFTSVVFAETDAVTRGLSAAEFSLPPAFLGRKGCIEFWARLVDGKTEFSTGGDPRLDELKIWNYDKTDFSLD